MAPRWYAYQTNSDLRDLIGKLQGTKSEIADQLGVRERTLYRWLSGDSKAPLTAVKLASVLTRGI